MSEAYRVVALPGEGVGPEVIEATLEVVSFAAPAWGVPIEVTRADFGIPAWEKHGSYLPDSTVALCDGADGILLGAVERGGLLELRSRFDFFANLRPVRALDCLVECSSLRPERAKEVDLLFVRELTSGIHFGKAERGRDASGEYGYHTMLYYDEQVRRIARVALEQAQRRSGRLSVAHKENALPCIPWQALVREEAERFPDVEVEGLLVDSLAMQLVMDPGRFDVIVAGNLIGDWLSSIGGALVGSIGLLPSASLNAEGFGLYEPIHGTAPEIAGRGVANPLGALGSFVLMLEQWGEVALARHLCAAQQRVLENGARTADLRVGSASREVSTAEMVELLLAELSREAGPGSPRR